MNKQFILLLILVATASSLLVAKTAYSSVPTPSVPEFTAKFEAYPYYVPPTYEIDQYTGKNVTKQEGYYVENKSIIITIKNQPFASSVNGTNYFLFYNIRYKGHFGEDWEEIYRYSNSYPLDSLPPMSNSEYTILSISAEDYPYSAKVDVQVEAILGHSYQVFEHYRFFLPDGEYAEHFAMDERSGWSEIQTVTISAPLSPLLYATLIVLLGVASLGLAFYSIKRKQSS